MRVVWKQRAAAQGKGGDSCEENKGAGMVFHVWNAPASALRAAPALCSNITCLHKSKHSEKPPRCIFITLCYPCGKDQFPNYSSPFVN
jgi:hypothetical protein